MRRLRKTVLFLTAAAVMFQAEHAIAAIVGFSYLANISSRQIEGTLPEALRPIVSSPAVFGSYYFDSDAADISGDPLLGAYRTEMPFVSGAHFLRWLVGSSVRPPEVSFQDTGVSVFDDWPIPNNPPLPQPEHLDSYSVGSSILQRVDGQSDLSAVLGSVFFIYSSIGPTNAPIGPLDSVDLPLTPPVLKDFTDGHYWEFNLQKFGRDGWRISLLGDVVRLELAEAPEPPVGWLCLAGLPLLLKLRALALRLC